MMMKTGLLLFTLPFAAAAAKMRGSYVAEEEPRVLGVPNNGLGAPQKGGGDGGCPDISVSTRWHVTPS